MQNLELSLYIFILRAWPISFITLRVIMLLRSVLKKDN